MQEFCPCGSVRGALGNRPPYRDNQRITVNATNAVPWIPKACPNETTRESPLRPALKNRGEIF
jgi:hypothetical protein